MVVDQQADGGDAQHKVVDEVTKKVGRVCA